MQTRTLILAMLTMMFSYSVFSQNMVGLQVDVFDPLSQFDTNLSGNPGGVSLFGLHRLTDSKFSIGGSLGVAMYANRKYDFGQGEEIVNVEEEDCFITTKALLRYSLYETGVVSTYAELSAGTTTFFSSREALDETEVLDDSFDFHGTSFNTGLGGGVTVNLSKLFQPDHLGNFILLDLGVKYGTGSRATYRNINDGDVLQNMEQGEYRSLTNHVLYQAGIALGF